MRIEIPRAVETIIGRLQEHGYEAFAVGGCVRDVLLERQPEDWDITTSARPEQVKALFGRTIDTGIRHGTVTVMWDHVGYEITTYRIDGEYQDGRHPGSVEFTTNLLEDLKRRDFTINAMAYSHETGVVDAFGGMEDLKEKRIRCVGNPMHRFTEDALRILRAIRFSAQLGFEVDPETEEAIRAIAPNLVHISKERIQSELTKLLLSDHPERIRLVYDTGISAYVSAGFHSLKGQPVRVNACLPAGKALRWAAFLTSAVPGQAVEILKDLKLDNDTIARVRTLCTWWNRPIATDEISVRRVMSQMDPEAFDELLLLRRSLDADGAGRTDELCRLTETIRGRGDCVSLKQLAVTGQDLIAAGVKPGRQMGELLQKMLDLVLENPELNQRETLLDFVENKAPGSF